MIWNIVSDSSCDLKRSGFTSDRVRFETVPLRIQVGEREFVITARATAVRCFSPPEISTG